MRDEKTCKECYIVACASPVLLKRSLAGLQRKVCHESVSSLEFRYVQRFASTEM